jgi:hypothetical protein
MKPETTTRHTASGFSWKCQPLNAIQVSASAPLTFELANVALKANEAKTITLWVYPGNSNYCRIRICENVLAGITADITDRNDSNGEWEQLSISVTPTADCVLPVYFEFWGNVNYSSYIDDFDIT